MAAILSFSKNPVVVGEPVTLKVVSSGSDSYVSVDWKRSSSGNYVARTTTTTWTIDEVKLSDAGNWVASATRSTGGSNTSDPVNLEVLNVINSISAHVSLDKLKYKIGEIFNASIMLTSIEPGPTSFSLSPKWEIDGEPVSDTSVVLSRIFSGEATTISGTVTISSPGYADKTVTIDPVTVTLADSDDDNYDYLYYNPIPERNAAFIQTGWWVINEIQRAKELGMDWKLAEDPLLYKRDLRTLAKIFKDYDNPEVQESRNGYVWNAAQVEAGYGLM